MESHHSSSPKLWLLGKERGEEAAYPDSYFDIKIIKNKFWDMLSGNCMSFYIFLKLQTANFEYGKHSLQMSDEQLPAIRKSHDHHMREI